MGFRCFTINKIGQQEIGVQKKKSVSDGFSSNHGVLDIKHRCIIPNIGVFTTCSKCISYYIISCHIISYHIIYIVYHIRSYHIVVFFIVSSFLFKLQGEIRWLVNSMLLSAIHGPVDQINDPAIAKLVYLVDKYIVNQC